MSSKRVLKVVYFNLEMEQSFSLKKERKVTTMISALQVIEVFTLRCTSINTAKAL